MNTGKDIHKAGGILIKDGKFLVCRNRGKTHFISPGGKLMRGERAEDALARELEEELNITIAISDLIPFGTFRAAAAGQKGLSIEMDVFIVKRWTGNMKPSSEVEEIAWISSHVPEGMSIGSIFEHEVLPRLKETKLID